MEQFFRYVVNDIGIYEAVDIHCPKDDLRRQAKPSGLWLPKSGPKLPGAISFWTETGLTQYKNSGLLDWHLSVLPNTVEVIIAELKTEPKYRDEFQVISNQNDFICSPAIFESEFRRRKLS